MILPILIVDLLIASIAFVLGLHIGVLFTLASVKRAEKTGSTSRIEEYNKMMLVAAELKELLEKADKL